MPNEHSIFCGGLSPGRRRWPGADPLVLRFSGSDPEITLKVEQITEALAKDISPRFLDLIEIATFAYVADQAITRGGDGVDVFGENWRRKLHFHIPVRDLDFWRSKQVVETLVETLSFLSEDEYHFRFEPLKRPPPLQQYFDFGEQASQSIEEVVLFSGGLDSLAGAIQEAVLDRRQVALVMHRSNEKLRKRHDHLTALLDTEAQSFRPKYFPVVINKKKNLGREYTQRSRSFLYASLAATFAELFHLNRIRFYENGVISLNLPISPQVVGAKATRTTHPRVLQGYARLFTLIMERPFSVENPFIWKTKTEIVRLIADAKCGHLIPYSTSCTHTWEMTKLHTHCGTCSQCIDRRFAILAANQAANDPAEAYKKQLLTEPHDDLGEDRTMLDAYVETAQRVSQMSEVEFLSNYGAVSRVVRHLPGRADAIGMKIFDLYKRHAAAVGGVVADAIAHHSQSILHRSLPDGCLIRLVCDTVAPTNGQPVVAVAPRPPLSLEPLAEEPYVFRENGQAWVFRFAGRTPKILLPSKGAAYLRQLFERPGKSISAVDLAYEVAKAPERFVLGDAGEKADPEAIRSYKAKYLELEEDLAKAESDGDEAAMERIKQERAVFAQEIQNSSWGGKLKREKDDRERIRKAVSIAITRTIRILTKLDTEFASHLSSPTLILGSSIVYNPAQPIVWDL